MVMMRQTQYYILSYIDHQKQCRLKNIYTHLTQEVPDSVRITVTETCFYQWMQAFQDMGFIRKVQHKHRHKCHYVLTEKGKQEINQNFKEWRERYQELKEWVEVMGILFDRKKPEKKEKSDSEILDFIFLRR